VAYFNVICRGDFDEGVIARLDERGVYWEENRVVALRSARRRRHHLIVEAGDGEEAIERAWDTVAAAGGEASDMTLAGPMAG
jgi:hypothetical protein